MEIVADVLGTMDFKAGDLTLEAGFFTAAFLLIAGVVLFLQPGRTASGSIMMSAGAVLGLTLFFFVQREKSGNFFGAVNALLPLLLAATGAFAGIVLKKHFSKPRFLKWLNIFNLVAASLALLVCLTGFARTHHNAILISAFGASFGLMALVSTLVILKQRPVRLANTAFFQADSLPYFLLFLSSMAISLTGYIVVSTPMILVAVAVAAAGLSISLQLSISDNCRIMAFLRKQVLD